MTPPRTHPLWRPYERPSEEEIAAARIGAHQPVAIEVVPYDPAWPDQFAQVRGIVVGALGAAALEITHVGSTSVPGLAAKPYLDVDLTVGDSADEDSYVPALTEAGFRLVVREPEWEEHRVLKLAQPNTNLHVFSPGAAEPQRHHLFTRWLREHPEDRAAYGEHKVAVAAQGFTDGMLYNNAKSALVYDLYEKIFAADPDHAHDPHPRA